ncbi:MAG: hypothetical protein KIS94_02895 [Chitinophagales bacterium]|nr:hypothetical protein [Chitinophagales bacterium]
MKLPLTKTAFWDTNFNELDEIQHADFIIARVFQYGLLQDIKAVIKHYKPFQIAHAIATQRGIMDKHAIALAEIFANK